jgi:hypothetical protein
MGREKRARYERDRYEGVELDRPDPVRGRYPRGPGGWHYGGLGYRPEPSGGMTGARRPPKGYFRSNDRVREDVCQALADEGELDATDIEVEVDRGVVTLRGKVADRGSKRRAETVAEAVRGVEDVQNALRIAAPPETQTPVKSNGNGERRR